MIRHKTVLTEHKEAYFLGLIYFILLEIFSDWTVSYLGVPGCVLGA